MEKKKILFIYPSMMLGGSTTAMISFMNSLDCSRYDIELQLFRNEGPLMNMLPEHVKLLPEARMYTGTRSRGMKLWEFFSSGYLFRAIWRGMCRGQKFSPELLADFSAKKLSRENTVQYDYAIGYLEGWSNRYLAWQVQAGKKYAWIHSTFSKVTQDPEAEQSWMADVDKVAFVTDACYDEFVQMVPSMKEKALVVENILDSEIVRKRSFMIDEQDEAYGDFVSADCFKLVTICRLQIQVKGLDRIVSAARELKQSGYSFLWYIIGNGEDEDALRKLINEAGLEDRIVLTGARMNPYPFIKVADAMCMPSRYEGRPLAVTESMILGVPPIVTEYLSAHEQIQNGVDGIIVANGEDTIADAIRYCMENRSKLEKIRKWLQQHEYGNQKSVCDIEKKLLA